MRVELQPIAIEEREILANLLEKYNYEFSQWDGRYVNELGLFGYRYLDYYWNEENRWAYFIRADGRLAGFVLVNAHPEAPDREMDFSVAEFFVMYRYRRAGVGSCAAKAAFDLHRGRWQVKYHPKNTGSAAFWNRVVQEYTDGQYELVRAYPGTEFTDGTPGDIIFFENGNHNPQGRRPAARL